MLNDPLLPPPPPPPSPSERTATRAMSTKTTPSKRTSKKPATAAKILVTGLSATAVIGMASGYALAGKTNATQITNSVINTGETSLTTAQAPAQNTPSSNAVAPSTASPEQTAAPQATPAPVIVVPVPQAAPATPGTSNNNWQQQQSSGSR